MNYNDFTTEASCSCKREMVRIEAKAVRLFVPTSLHKTILAAQRCGSNKPFKKVQD